MDTGKSQLLKTSKDTSAATNLLTQSNKDVADSGYPVDNPTGYTYRDVQDRRF